MNAVGEGTRRGRIDPWGVAYAILSAGCLLTAGYATYRIQTLEGSAAWIETRLRTQADDYEATLHSRFVDQETQTFRERHELLALSSTWWQARLGLLMLWALATFAFYIHRVIANFSEEVVESSRAAPRV